MLFSVVHHLRIGLSVRFTLSNIPTDMIDGHLPSLSYQHEALSVSLLHDH